MSDSQMRAFIEGILRDMEGNALLSLATGKTDPTDAAPHGKLIVNDHYWFTYPQDLDRMVAFAEKARAERRDAYISPIIYGSKPYFSKKLGRTVDTIKGRRVFSRSLDNALFAQTIYMDSDSCPPDAFRIPPSRHVQTSDGHGHDYWYLSQYIPASTAAEIAHRITTAHKDDGCDPSGWSANKVLRLPTFNTGYDELSPFEVTWAESVEAQGGEVYDALDISGAYDDVEVLERRELHRELPPVPPVEGLPDFESLVAQIPATNRRLNDLIYKVPKGGPDGWRSEQRYALLLDLKRFGFTDVEVVTIAWHSPAASKWREDARGIDGLWWELQARVIPVIEDERGGAVPNRPRDIQNRPPLELLSPEQRRRVENRSDFITFYLEYARMRVQTINEPYHVINAWSYLSLALGEAAEIPKAPEPMGLNIYSTTLGLSSSGKDEADDVYLPFQNALFPHDPIHIPAYSSFENFIELLISRDSKVSVVNDNESGALISKIASNSAGMGGMFDAWTRVYDGKIPSLGRVSKKDLNKPGARAIMTMRLMGTPKRVLGALDKELFYSGLLARTIWVIGEEPRRTRESMRTKFSFGEEVAKAPDAMPRYFASHFAGIRARLRAAAPFDRKRASLYPTDEAIAMADKARWDAYEYFSHEYDEELWMTVLNRMADIVWKIAGLSAASDARGFITSRDVEVALYHAEIWLGNAVEVSRGVAENDHARACNEIEKFVASQKGQEADLGQIHRFRTGEPKYEIDRYLESLVFQSRLLTGKHETGPRRGTTYYKIRETQ